MFGDFLENDIIKFSILRKYLSPRIKKNIGHLFKECKDKQVALFFEDNGLDNQKKSKYGACPEEKETHHSLICGIIRNN